jgi:8-oxo-dGTP pyrophosphatase MutT (NUDIX family)
MDQVQEQKPASLDLRQTPFLAVHLFLARGDEILWLLRQGTGWLDGFYSVVAGHVDVGESAIAAMIREAREEVGISLSPQQLEHVVTVHRDSDTERVDFFFLARDFEGEVCNMEPDKCGALTWASFEQAPTPRVPYVEAAFEAWREGKAYIEFGWEEQFTTPLVS